MINEEKKHVQGKPWKIEAKFQTYEEAKKFYLELENSDNPPKEIKIKHSSSSNLFFVKVRHEDKNKNNSNKKNKNKSKSEF